jgi:hypothetical protein
MFNHQGAVKDDIRLWSAMLRSNLDDGLGARYGGAIAEQDSGGNGRCLGHW